MSTKKEKERSVKLTAQECRLLTETVDQSMYAGKYAKLVAGVLEKLRREATPK